MSDTVEFGVCGDCYHKAGSLRTPEDWEPYRLIEERRDNENHTVWRCPKCEKVVKHMMDGGTIDFGTIDFGVGADPNADAGPTFFETFEPIVRKPDG